MPTMQKDEMRRWKKVRRGRKGDGGALVRSAVLHYGAEVPGSHMAGLTAARQLQDRRLRIAGLSMCGECWSSRRRARLHNDGDSNGAPTAAAQRRACMQLVVA
jgi:hypothetical protein